jgi:hypothetical protein
MRDDAKAQTATSPFLDDFLNQAPRHLSAGQLNTELRETIARWFSTRDTPTIQNSELILWALADLAAEQITANATYAAQIKVMHGVIHDIFRRCNAANRRRLGGVPVTIVKQ